MEEYFCFIWRVIRKYKVEFKYHIMFVFRNITISWQFITTICCIDELMTNSYEFVLFVPFYSVIVYLFIIECLRLVQTIELALFSKNNSLFLQRILCKLATNLPKYKSFFFFVKLGWEELYSHF